jgi:hypothetical protein
VSPIWASDLRCVEVENVDVKPVSLSDIGGQEAHCHNSINKGRWRGKERRERDRTVKKMSLCLRTQRTPSTPFAFKNYHSRPMVLSGHCRGKAYIDGVERTVIGPGVTRNRMTPSTQNLVVSVTGRKTYKDIHRI